MKTIFKKSGITTSGLGKTSIITFITICLFLLDLKLQAAKKGIPDTDSVTCLEIDGRLLNLPKKISATYKVELIQSNAVLETVVIKNRDSFKFRLKKNTHYAIRILKDGFVTRLISIHTDLPKDAKGIHQFQFDTELITEAEAKTLDTDALDFPIALVTYDKDINSFYYNEDYTADIKRQIYKGVLSKN